MDRDTIETRKDELVPVQIKLPKKLWMAVRIDAMRRKLDGEKGISAQAIIAQIVRQHLGEESPCQQEQS